MREGFLEAAVVPYFLQPPRFGDRPVDDCYPTDVVGEVGGHDRDC